MRGGEEIYAANYLMKVLSVLIFEEGQSISLCSRGLTIVVDGVEQAVTGGSLRQSPPSVGIRLDKTLFSGNVQVSFSVPQISNWCNISNFPVR